MDCDFISLILRCASIQSFRGAIFALAVGKTAVVISMLCFGLSIYLGVIGSFAVAEATLKTQFVSLSTSFFIGGIIVLVCWIVFFILEKAISPRE